MNELVAAAWQLASKYADLPTLLNRLAPQLTQRFPVGALAVMEWIPDRQALETVADESFDERIAIDTAPRSLTPTRAQELLRWIGKSSDGELLPPSDTLQRDIHAGESAILVPLRDGKTALGIAVLCPREGERFAKRAESTLASLAGPFAAALVNDQRVRELAGLRASAEADRQTLLVRLGRKEMSESIVGADKGLRLVMERVEMVAPADAPVLILGDTGSGKEVIARAIHERSARHDRPFIRVNCGAIPPELIDSQLFGHEKGSFTGAADQRQGWFERANGGTLFLDEIGELPLPAQVRLLRVLQDHHFERVGGQHAVHVDVRIVAATHRDLAEMVSRGAFRQDLWYRINVFPLLLPRLCERTEDIPDLVRHFAHRAAARFGLTYVDPTAADLLTLSSYPWPGNVRELAAVIDRATILGRGVRLDVTTALGWSGQDHRPPSPGPSHGAASSSAAAEVADGSGDMSLDGAIARHIERALVATRGRIEGPKGAASLLEINPHTLRAKMRKLRIDWSRFRE